MFLSPFPPPFNVELACVQDHVELKQTTSRCQHWCWGEGGAQKKKTGHTHTVQTSSWSRHHSNVLILLSREPRFFWGSDYRWKCLHSYSSNVKYWLVMLVKNACKAISNHSKYFLALLRYCPWSHVAVLCPMSDFRLSTFDFRLSLSDFRFPTSNVSL